MICISFYHYNWNIMLRVSIKFFVGNKINACSSSPNDLSRWGGLIQLIKLIFLFFYIWNDGIEKKIINIIKKNSKTLVWLFVWYLINPSNPQFRLWTPLDQFNFCYMIKNTKINTLSTQYWIIKFKKKH
jgi:hypothetical protein